jgi:hypothetical protein
LFEKIEKALCKHANTTTVHLSITPEPEEFRDPDTGETYIVKWLSWKLFAGSQQLTEPELEVVGDWLTEDQIRGDFARFLSHIVAIVDNEISFEEDS